MGGVNDSDGEQSDFKTTTLRFTNNNFINEQQRRDNSQGAAGRAEGPERGSSLLNTLNSQTGAQVQQVARNNRFGTSDNFKVGPDVRTDGFRRDNNSLSKSPSAKR